MWLSDFRVVLPDTVLERASVRLESGFIAEIVEGPRAGLDGESLDGRGLTLMPGIVDLHGDMLERELEPRPGTLFPVEIALQELDKRLISNGITTAYAAVALADGPGLRSEDRARALIDAIFTHRGALLVEMWVHARFEVTMPAVVRMVSELLRAGQIQIVSLDLFHKSRGRVGDVLRRPMSGQSPRFQACHWGQPGSVC